MCDFSNPIGIYIKMSTGEVLKIRLLGLTPIFLQDHESPVASLLSAFERVLQKDKGNNLMAQKTNKLGK